MFSGKMRIAKMNQRVPHSRGKKLSAIQKNHEQIVLDSASESSDDDPNINDKERKYIQKMGPLCPVFGKMKHLGKNKTYEIKSFRVWVHWSDGDWTAETKKSFDNSEQRRKIQTWIDKGAEVWPWPDGAGVTNQMKRRALRERKMTAWQCKNGGTWIKKPQNEPNGDDSDTDLPNQPDELFEISERSQDEESVSESDDEV